MTSCGDLCSHPGLSEWIEQNLKKRKGWVELDKLCSAMSSLPDTHRACRCEVPEVLKSSTFQKHFLIRENVVFLKTSYENGLKKLRNLLQERGPLSLKTLHKNLRQVLTEGEEVALGRNKKDLKSTVCSESAIFSTEPFTGLIVLCGVHPILDQSCCHSGVIGWIEQCLKEHSGWSTIDDMNKYKSQLCAGKQSCKCALGSLIMLPNIRKHFHVQGNYVFEKSYYRSGLQKMTDVLVRNGPTKINVLLKMLKDAGNLSETELRALGENEKALSDTICKEQQLFQPLSHSGRVHLKSGCRKPCRHKALIVWINSYLNKCNEWVSIEKLCEATSKIPNSENLCRCELSEVLHDEKQSFHVQGNDICSRSLFSSNYRSGIKKMEDFLKKKGPQPVGILLNMLKQCKVMTANEERVLGRNKKELAYTITREPSVFKFVSPPGVVMLRTSQHEDKNQVTKVLEYLEKYLRTCQKCYVKTLLKQVVRHESLSTGCISGVHSLRKLLAAHPERFLIHGDGSVSLTKRRRKALSDPPKSHGIKRHGAPEVSVEQSVDEPGHARVPCSSTEDMNSSKSLNAGDKNINLDSASICKRTEISPDAGKSESSRDFNRGLCFIEKLLENHGPMMLQDIHTSIVASSKLDKPARRILGRTPEELLSILLLQKDTFHVIPPSDLVVLCKTAQMKVNPWVTGLKKVEEYLKRSRHLDELVDFIRSNLTVQERRVFGESKKKVNHTLALCKDRFLNSSGIIILRSAHVPLSRVEGGVTKRKIKGKDNPECTEENTSKKRKTDPKFQTPRGSVVVHVVETAEEWALACSSLYESKSSVVGIECDSKWFVLKQWDGKVIAAKIQRCVAQASSKSEQPVGQSRTPSKTGDIFEQLSLLLTSSTILKVVYDVQKISSMLRDKMPLNIENVFDIKVANQLISRTSLSHWIPHPLSFTELCERYSIVPSAVVQVVSQTVSGVDDQDVANLKNMAVLTCTLIPHFLRKMYRDLNVDLLTEHNCIVEELCNAWRKGPQSRLSSSRDPNISSAPEQEMPSMQTPQPCITDCHVPVGEPSTAGECDPGRQFPASAEEPGSGTQPLEHTKAVSGQEQGTRLASTHILDPHPLLQSGSSFIPCDSGLRSGIHPPGDPETTSIQELGFSLISAQIVNTHAPIMKAGGSCTPWASGSQSRNLSPKDLKATSIHEQGASVVSKQVVDPCVPDTPILHSQPSCVPWVSAWQSGTHAPQYTNATSVQMQGMPATIKPILKIPKPGPNHIGDVCLAGNGEVGMSVLNKCLPNPQTLYADVLYAPKESVLSHENQLPTNPNSSAGRAQEITSSSTQIPNPPLQDPRVRHVEELYEALEAGLGAGKYLHKYSRKSSAKKQQKHL
ncbi:uncharacterized protein LOC121411212 [Lytechinus variegatus]|uniref:uncharacterized protein LOC121411212 n=1 Tax=Lytechinus variegatus TaxID=7654 RepID=UPI001BB29291|nr:uncharacterized protein LOC121411212 [Lytechinus variegatus]